MDQCPTPCEKTEKFIQRWQISKASERVHRKASSLNCANCWTCPGSHGTTDRDYMFERALKVAHVDSYHQTRHPTSLVYHRAWTNQSRSRRAQRLTSPPAMDAIAANF